MICINNACKISSSDIPKTRHKMSSSCQKEKQPDQDKSTMSFQLCERQITDIETGQCSSFVIDGNFTVVAMVNKLASLWHEATISLVASFVYSPVIGSYTTNDSLDGCFVHPRKIINRNESDQRCTANTAPKIALYCRDDTSLFQ